MAGLGSIFLSFNGFLVQITGALFDTLVQYVIIGFGQTVGNGTANVSNSLNIIGPINVGWSVFRDVANILIIGMFVFIAICTILGIQQYGARKLMARVIIVAVLLNFSLLFTKMIIDFSNFAAYQFYNAAANTVQQTSGATSANGNASFDIAAAFLTPMGITDIWNTYYLTCTAGGGTNCGTAPAGTVAPSATANQTPAAQSQSSTKALLYGMAGGAMLAGVAIVLFYGSFQIAARAIMLVFLMLTASVAFASYLVPKFADGNYGWKAWWTSLLNAAVFAPLLMIFLFISLEILNGVKTLMQQLNVQQNGALSTFLNNPTGAITSSGTWQAIFVYILVLGLLYASVKISSKVASNVGSGILQGGINLAGAFATGGVGLLSRGVAAPILRNTVGARAYGRAERRGSEAKEAVSRAITFDATGDTAAANKAYREAYRSKRQADRASTVAKSKMNVMDTRPAKYVASKVGLKGVFESSKTTKSYATARKDEGEAIAKIAESLRPDTGAAQAKNAEQIRNDNRNALDQRKSAERIAREEAERAKVQSETAKKAHEEELVAISKKQGKAVELETHERARDTAHDGWKQALAEAAKQVSNPQQRAEIEQKVNAATPENSSADSLKNIEQQIVQSISDPKLRQTVTAQIETSKGARESEMRHEEERIVQARAQTIDRAKGDQQVKNEGGTNLAQLEAQTKEAQDRLTIANRRVQETSKATSDFEKSVEDQIKASNAALANTINTGMKGLVRSVAEQNRSIVKRAFMPGTLTKADEESAKVAMKEIERRHKNKQTLDIAKALRTVEQEENGGAAAGGGGGDHH